MASNAPATRKAAVAAYERACLQGGQDPYPADQRLFRLALQGFALRRARRGLSHLAGHAYVDCVIKQQRLAGRPALPPLEHELLLAALARIAVQYPATVKRAEPFGTAELALLDDYLAPFYDRGDRYAAQMSAIATIAVRGKMRPGEVLKLRWRQLGESPCAKFLTVWLPLRKSRKTTISGSDLLTLPRDGDSCDPLAAMRRHAAACGMPGPRRGSKPKLSGARVFTPLHMNGKASPAEPRSWLNRQLKRLCALAGIPKAQHLFRRTGQGFRRGGHSDELAAGVDPGHASAAGGWTSKAALLYDVRRGRLAAQTSRLLAASSHR